jgi:hypothetical protein
MVSIGEVVPDLGFTNVGFVVSIVTFLIFAVIFIVAVTIITYLIVSKLKYKNKIVIFENVAGRYEPTKKDFASEIKFGDLGDKVFYARKNKKFLPRPAKQVGKRTFWYAVDDNGLWHNIGDFDINVPSGSAQADYIDRGMLYSAVGMRKNMKERFQKITFLERYGALIAYVVLIAIIGIMMWLLIDKFIEVAQATNTAVQTANKVLETSNSVVAKLDSICSGGSGLKVA